YDHDISLPGGCARRHAESVHVVYRRSRNHKLKRTARDAKRHGEHRREARPIDQVVQCRYNDASFFQTSLPQSFHYPFWFLIAASSSEAFIHFFWNRRFILREPGIRLYPIEIALSPCPNQSQRQNYIKMPHHYH